MGHSYSMHQCKALLMAENAALRAENHFQKQKRARKKGFIRKGGSMTIQEGQESIERSMLLSNHTITSRMSIQQFQRNSKRLLPNEHHHVVVSVAHLTTRQGDAVRNAIDLVPICVVLLLEFGFKGRWGVILTHSPV